LNTLIHSRHRSPINAFSHLFAGLINYQIRTDKRKRTGNQLIDKNKIIV